MRLDRLVFLLLIGASAGPAAQACAQIYAPTWPARPIRAIVPFSAGSASDVIPRVVLEQISTQLGQPIVVENRVGASGTLGTAAVAKAEPDGHTLLANSGAHTVTPWTVPSIPYDILTDFVSVAPFAVLPNVLVIAPSKGIRTVQELVAAARTKPGAMTFASAGVGSATHLNGELFLRSAKFKAMHIPFKGGPEALTEVLTGRVDFYFVPVLPALPLLREGKLLALAVSTSKRASSLPDVPTTVEAGFANSEYNFWVGLFAPAGTPREIVARLHDEAQKALRTPALTARLAFLGADPMTMRQPEFDAYVRADHAAMGELVKTSGIGVK